VITVIGLLYKYKNMSNLRWIDVISVRSMDDFPAPVAWVITLTSGIYNISVTLVTSNRLVIADGAVVSLIWTDPFLSGFVYTWTGDFISWWNFLSLTHELIFISTPLWKLFNVTNASPTAAQIFVINTVYVDVTDIWILKNIDAVLWYFNAFQDIWQW